MSGVDGEKQGAVRSGGSQVSGRVADHQDGIFSVLPSGSQLQVIFFAAEFLPRNDRRVPGDVVFLPLAFQGLTRGRRNADDVRTARELIYALAEIGERGNAFHHVGNRAVHGLAPFERQSQDRVAGLHGCFFQCGVAERDTGVNPGLEGRDLGNLDPAPHGFRPVSKQLEGLGQSREAIDPSPFGIEVDELGRGTRVL